MAIWNIKFFRIAAMILAHSEAPQLGRQVLVCFRAKQQLCRPSVEAGKER